MKKLFALLALLAPVLASAHCYPGKLVGDWEFRAAGGAAAAAGVVTFTADQTASFVSTFSQRGSPPGLIRVAPGHYDLDWLPSALPDGAGTCRISATWTHDGVTERYSLLFSAALAKPRTLQGVDAVAWDGKTPPELPPFTLTVTAARRAVAHP
jgi:hypothetical protein